MKTATLDFSWKADTWTNEISTARSRPCSPESFSAARAVGTSNPAPVSSLRCPHCHSIVYSRKSRWCGVCNRTLPAEFLFSPAQIRRIDHLLQSEREKHRRWMGKAFGQIFSLLLWA